MRKHSWDDLPVSRMVERMRKDATRGSKYSLTLFLKFITEHYGEAVIKVGWLRKNFELVLSDIRNTDRTGKGTKIVGTGVARAIKDVMIKRLDTYGHWLPDDNPATLVKPTVNICLHNGRVVLLDKRGEVNVNFFDFDVKNMPGKALTQYDGKPCLKEEL